ncbi:uncharacterized protein PODANS_5_11210 [Podospora anserina S mat+]|uniref:Podospora anserina S mat+ genomic DNA chromosome 5, supercontig 10 n=2 Tax=Podospora TaxID=5144 RepID=B2APQ9_PODAN|nr:uncharacterized protein PODANS_5_11210 [Podospora anserina S mat+]KAK4676286.1 hypothetical protein QC764_511210 [Podospora pseudoanserina]CAP65925.1 unnamed protein product [Podospora anserina S mat+]CDP30212.1 Putative protein of unknown function [Podospora anserina S mat+]
MVGVTTIANLNAPAGKQISLYYNLKNQNLGLQQRNESTSQDPPTDVYVSSITAQVGWIENPSQVASANLTGLPLVFGFTEKKADPAVPKQLNHDVSILSPVYNPVGQTLKDNKTIAAVSDGVSASVFFLTGGSGNAYKIEEAVVGQIQPDDWSGTAVIIQDSSLAAYYSEPGVRRIIYQAADNSEIHDYRPKRGYVNIGNTNAKDASPLAVVTAGSKAYLYYVNTHDQVKRIVKSDLSNPDSWGQEQDVNAPKKVSKESQITVISAGGKNHLFYVAQGASDTTFEHIVDSQ